MGRGRVVGVAGCLLATLVIASGCTTQEEVGGPSESVSMRSSSVGSRTQSLVTTASSSGSGASPSAPPVTGSTTTSSAPTTATSRTRTSPTTAAPPKRPMPLPSVGLPTGVAKEASGLTPAGDGAFWTVDDATGTDSLIAVDERGRRIGSLQVDGLSADNAEALSSGACTVGSAARCLFVGDLGDHVGRDHVTIHRVPEPASAAGDHRADDTAWRYTYPDGARNAESMFVAPDGSLVVIDKPQRADDGSVRAHHVYRGAPGGGVLQLVGSYLPPEPARPLQSMFEGNVVTDAALQVGSTQTRVLVQFYDQVLQYTAPRPSADPATFFRWPHIALADPDLIQAEGIAPLADGCGFASISEAGPGGSVARLTVAPCR